MKHQFNGIHRGFISKGDEFSDYKDFDTNSKQYHERIKISNRNKNSYENQNIIDAMIAGATVNLTKGTFRSRLYSENIEEQKLSPEIQEHYRKLGEHYNRSRSTGKLTDLK